MGAARVALRLVLAMAAAVPVGSAGWLAWEAVRHPWLGRAIINHPLLALGMIAGGGGVASVAWGAAALAGIDLSWRAGALHGWIVVAACIIYLWRDNPFRTER